MLDATAAAGSLRIHKYLQKPKKNIYYFHISFLLLSQRFRKMRIIWGLHESSKKSGFYLVPITRTLHVIQPKKSIFQ
jgi:hypothetical protein